MSEELYFAHLPYVRIQEILDSPRAPVLLWPVGSTEPHGPHSPLATDPISRSALPSASPAASPTTRR